MKEFILDAEGIGDVPSYLAQEGLELAIRYFENNDLSPAECYQAYKLDKESELGMAWYAAETEANKVLLGNERYENSMIILTNECD